MASRIRIAGLCAAVAGTALVGGATASAKTTVAGAHAVAAAGKQTVRTPQTAAAVPSGYLVVSANFTAPNGLQTRGSVACPAAGSTARYPQSGGAIIASSDLNANINSSFPSGTSWIVDVNNNSGADTTFNVYAVCAKPKAGYTVATTSVTNFNGFQNTGTAVCPTGTRILGGGAVSSTFSVFTNINSSIPVGNGWRVDMNNASGADASFTVYAVCSNYTVSRTGYTVVSGSPVTNVAGTETFASVSCPSGDVPLGGGGFSGSGSTAVNMNSTAPSGSGWIVYENNATTVDTTITAYAVCAF